MRQNAATRQRSILLLVQLWEQNRIPYVRAKGSQTAVDATQANFRSRAPLQPVPEFLLRVYLRERRDHRIKHLSEDLTALATRGLIRFEETDWWPWAFALQFLPPDGIPVTIRATAHDAEWTGIDLVSCRGDGKKHRSTSTVLDSNAEQMEAQHHGWLLTDAGELELDVPPLDKKSEDWLKTADAARLACVSPQRLRALRGEGALADDEMSGQDRYGREWRRGGQTDKSHVYYLRSSLLSSNSPT